MYSWHLGNVFCGEGPSVLGTRSTRICRYSRARAGVPGIVSWQLQHSVFFSLAPALALEVRLGHGGGGSTASVGIGIFLVALPAYQPDNQGSNEDNAYTGASTNRSHVTSLNSVYICFGNHVVAVVVSRSNLVRNQVGDVGDITG